MPPAGRGEGGIAARASLFLRASARRAAFRISGVNLADISVLLVYFGQYGKENDAETG